MPQSAKKADQAPTNSAKPSTIHRSKKDTTLSDAAVSLDTLSPHNNSWYPTCEGEPRDRLVYGKFPPIRRAFKRPYTLLDSHSLSRDTAITNERSSFMHSCTNGLRRDVELRYTLTRRGVTRGSEVSETAQYDVLPCPKYVPSTAVSSLSRGSPVMFDAPSKNAGVVEARGTRFDGVPAEIKTRFEVRAHSVAS